MAFDNGTDMRQCVVPGKPHIAYVRGYWRVCQIPKSGANSKVYGERVFYWNNAHWFVRRLNHYNYFKEPNDGATGN